MLKNIFNTQNRKVINSAKKVYAFYYDGFKGMVLGRKLWKIIFIKLFIMFAILKVFFFPDFLNTHFQTNEEKSIYVLEQITKNTSLISEEELNK